MEHDQEMEGLVCAELWASHPEGTDHSNRAALRGPILQQALEKWKQMPTPFLSLSPFTHTTWVSNEAKSVTHPYFICCQARNSKISSLHAFLTPACSLCP